MSILKEVWEVIYDVDKGVASPASPSFLSSLFEVGNGFARVLGSSFPKNRALKILALQTSSGKPILGITSSAE